MDNAHALVIGIADYQQINQLPPTVLKDVQDIRDLLVDPHRCGYPPDQVQLLLDGEATQAAICESLAALARARSARQLATCDGPPDTTYQVAYEETGALLERLGVAP